MGKQENRKNRKTGKPENQKNGKRENQKNGKSEAFKGYSTSLYYILYIKLKKLK